MGKNPAKRRKYVTLTLEEAMRLIEREVLNRWQINAPPRPPGEILLTTLQRLRIFELENSSPAKMLWVDALLAEIVNDHSRLKIWKSEPLETDTLTGVADYLFAPCRAYLATPLLCVTEAKRDDFEKGRIQCLAEMYACQWNNRRSGLDIDTYGIVSNGQVWRYYKLTQAGDAYETSQYSITDMLGLLGALNYICAECSKNVPG